MKKILLCFFVFFGMCTTGFAAYNTTDIYLLAQSKSTTELKKIENIDVVDSTGNTALCSAIRYGDVDAYSKLKEAGANTEHKCTKKIPAEQYKTFIQKVANTSKPWSFLGLGKWAWGGIGAAAVGGAVAMSGGGGGGGSISENSDCSGSTSPDCLPNNIYKYPMNEPCPDGWRSAFCATDKNGVCWGACDTPESCPYDYVEECGNGQEETGNTCKSGDKIYKQCIEKKCEGYTSFCEDGYEEVPGDTCLSGDTLLVKCQPNHAKICEGFDFTDNDQCPRGYELGSSCQSGETIMYKCDAPADCSDFDYNNSSQCPAGYTIGSSCLSGATTTYKCDALIQCPYHTIECVGGYVATGNTCQSGETIYKECKPVQCNEGDVWSEQGCITTSQYGLKGNGKYDKKTNNHILFNNDTIAIVFDNQAQAEDSPYQLFGIRKDYFYGGGNDRLYNAYDSVATLHIVNNSGRTVVGMGGGAHASAALEQVDYRLSIANAAANDKDAFGTMYIENNGPGVFAIKGSTARNAWGQAQDKNAYGTIHINSNGGATTGLHGYFAYNAASLYGGRAYGEIIINNKGDGSVYGLYAVDEAANSTGSNAKGILQINNIGDGNVYGLYSDNYAYNSYDSTIQISNNGQGNTYGIKSYKATNNNSSIIKIQNAGSGIAHGMNAELSARNHAEISITNQNTGLAAGIYTRGDFSDTDNKPGIGYNEESGKINIQNLSSGQIAGMRVKHGEVHNDGQIYLNNIDTGSAIGIYGEDSTQFYYIYNDGSINITRDIYVDEDSVVYKPNVEVAGDTIGIYATIRGLVYNYGDINIITNGNAYGIYAGTASRVNNAGNITIDATGNAYGIYVEGNSTVTNTGTITLNGVSCSGAECNTGNYIVLNGSTLVNAGTMSADTLSLNSMGGTVRAATGSRFVATDAITGDLNISSELVSGGNQTTYVAENMIDAGDVSGLNLVSESALFNARLASNGHDVVMTMRGFDEFTDNKSLAAFLEHNYATGNNTDLFGDLKSIGTNAAFMGALNAFSGLGAFNQFANEDLAAMREMNFSMNEQLFETSGRDDVDISGGVNYFSFSNQSGVGSGSYGLSIDRISDKWKMGYGISMANISTGNDDGINRQNTIGLFYMPMTYTDSGYEVIVNPKIGFSRGEYNRQGFNNMSYEGYIEKRIFGLMNDIRYPLTFGNWTVAPNLGLNAIVYNQSGHEENKMYGLIIPDSNLVSVEAGLGLYAKYDRTFADNSRLSFNTGLMAYREFGDCYNIKLGIRGMDGTFDLYDNNLYDYRGAATIGFKYNSGRLNLYGNAQYFTDSDSYMNLKAGIRFAF
ncbi:MAG: hypothetical protein R8M37_01725 [Alphaproteobacteria bacterium]|nr:hypothetical protein [Alphaproteobacteria bacterium]